MKRVDVDKNLAVELGHEHIMVQDVFSPTAVEYVVGGNYMFAAREVLVI